MAKEVKEAVENAVGIMVNYSAQLYYYLTKEMVNDYGEEAASKTIEKAIRGFGLERGGNIRKAALAAGEELTIRNLDRFYDMPKAEPWEPRTEYADGDENIKQACNKSCGFAKYWMDKDWAKIGHLFCGVDTAIREGYSEGICFATGKNLLAGDDCCTFTTTYKQDAK